MLVGVDVGSGVSVGVAVGGKGVSVGIWVTVGVAVGVPTSPSVIETTYPLAVAESIDTVMPFPESVKVSPTVHIAPSSPVSPSPSMSTT